MSQKATPTPNPDLEYWSDRLQGKEQCLFPSLNDGIKELQGLCQIEAQVPNLNSLQRFCTIHDLQLHTIFQTAWGLVLRSYTRTEDVCFGFKDSSSHPIPRHVSLLRESGLKHALDSVESSFVHDINHTGCRLEDVEAALNVGQAGFFNTYLEIRTPSSAHVNGDIHATSTKSKEDENGTLDYLEKRCMIGVEVDIGPVSASMVIKYRLSDLSKGQAMNVTSALEQALAGILEGNQKTVGEIDLFSSYHQQRISGWSRRPRTLELTYHEAFAVHARERPDAAAVHAWDVDFTYGEVDQLSTILARHLIGVGLRPGMRVPLVFEKSGFWVIALLAVSKCGAAFVPIDPSQPLLRLKEIVDDVDPIILLSSEKHSILLADCVETTVVVSSSVLESISGNEFQGLPLPDVPYTSAAYIMFTSGSTGRPKGAIQQHGGSLAGFQQWAEGTTLGPESRVLQSSSYAWTICIIDTICALWYGACLCIPSDWDRANALTEAFEDMHITWAILSPSMIKTVRQESVRHLESLTLCGEPVGQDLVAKWSSEKTKVFVCWAATECLAFARPTFTAESDVLNLGPCKALCRVVEIGNPEQQVPIGAIGELVVHAPWSAEGYLNDVARSKATFLDRLDWLNGVPSKYGSRWYRAGDLVRQNSDGTLVLAGRGDNMVKVRGQRFDLSEVERRLGTLGRIRNSLPLLPKVGVCKHRLVAVIALQDFASQEEGGKNALELLIGPELQVAASWVSQARIDLSEHLPSFAIPTLWIMVRQFPLTVTGKMDRMLLTKFVQNMSVKNYDEISGLGIVREPTKTLMEKRLQRIWSDVLNIPLEKIGRNQSFISLGGDSILAMIVGARCTTEKLQLKAQDILRYGTIAELAIQATPTLDETPQDLLFATQFKELRKSITEKLSQVGISDLANVEDAYPSSPMQQGMLLSKARHVGDYNTTNIYEITSVIGERLSVEKLQHAWQQVVSRHSILRTFFIESVSQTGSFDQVVLRNYDVSSATQILRDISTQTTEHIIELFEKNQSDPYVTTRPPHNFTIIQTKSGRTFCRMNIEHTLVDGMSLAVIVRDLSLAYSESLPTEPIPSYSTYIALLQQVVCSIDNKYWKSYLDGVNPCILPNLTYSLSREPPKAEARSISVNLRNSHHLLKFCQSQNVTLSALFRTVWGLILRAYTGVDEVCFGFITSGRDLPLAGIEEIVGTFINMLVCRMDLKDSTLVMDAISKAQTDYLNSLPHQQASLAQIQHVLGLYGQPLFNTSMTILKKVHLDSGVGNEVAFDVVHEWSPNEYDMDVQVWVSSTTIKMELWYRSEVISDEHANNIASTFSRALDAITDDPDQRVGQLDLFSDHHKGQVWDWNAKYPDVIDVCLHDLISHQVAERPNELAVRAWDRDLTFRELDSDAEKLARYLVSLGVGPEITVLLCFEKSCLAIVAMLAVLKAGGVCVSIDPTHPVQRLQTIIHDTRPLCCLVSTLHSKLFKLDEMSRNLNRVVEVQPTLFTTYYI